MSRRQPSVKAMRSYPRPDVRKRVNGGGRGIGTPWRSRTLRFRTRGSNAGAAVFSSRSTERNQSATWRGGFTCRSTSGSGSRIRQERTAGMSRAKQEEMFVQFVLKFGVPRARKLVEAVAEVLRRERHNERERPKLQKRRAGPKQRRGFAAM